MHTKRNTWRTLLVIAVVAVLGIALIGGDRQVLASGDAIKEKIVIKVGFEPNPGEPTELSAKEWARLVKEKSDGKVELQIYPSSQLGSKKDLIEQATMGINVITITDFSFLAEYVPDFNVLAGPYMGDDFDDIFKLTETDWFKDLSKQLDDKGIHILSTNWAFGVRHMIAKKPVYKPADLNGQKIRVSNNKMFLESFKAMGATPIPMPWGEAYTAITQGVIDGCDNPLPFLYGAKIHEAAKYVILTGHMNMISQWVIGRNYWESLPDKVKTILVEAADEAGVYNNKIVAEADKAMLEKYRQEGITIIEPDREAFREATKGVYRSFPEWTPGLYDEVMSLLGEK